MKWDGMGWDERAMLLLLRWVAFYAMPVPSLCVYLLYTILGEL